MKKGDRLGKKREGENTKKSRGAEKICVWGGSRYCMQLHQQLNAVISREGRRRVIVTLLFGWELLLSAIQQSNQKALGWTIMSIQLIQMINGNGNTELQYTWMIKERISS